MNNNTTKNNSGKKNKIQPTKEECLASYKIPIPEETLKLAIEKGLHIQRCDEVITKRNKKNGKSKGKIRSTAKQAKGIRGTKLCSYQVYNSNGKKVCKGSFKLSLQELIVFVEQYDSTEEDLVSDKYMPPFKYLKEKKHLKENQSFLNRIGKDLKYENGKFWIIEENGDIAVGSENGFQYIKNVSAFIRKNYKNAKNEFPTNQKDSMSNVKEKNVDIPLENETVEKTISEEVVEHSEIKEKLAKKKYMYITDKYGTALYKIINVSEKKMQIFCDWVREQNDEVDPTLVIDSDEASIYKIRRTPSGEKLRKNAVMGLQKN